MWKFSKKQEEHGACAQSAQLPPEHERTPKNRKNGKNGKNWKNMENNEGPFICMSPGTLESKEVAIQIYIVIKNIHPPPTPDPNSRAHMCPN